MSHDTKVFIVAYALFFAAVAFVSCQAAPG